MGRNTPLKAIRQHCLRCAGADFPWDYLGVPVGMRMFKQTVKDCPFRACEFWPWREGRMPHKPKSAGGEVIPAKD